MARKKNEKVVSWNRKQKMHQELKQKVVKSAKSEMWNLYKDQEKKNGTAEIEIVRW